MSKEIEHLNFVGPVIEKSKRMALDMCDKDVEKLILDKALANLKSRIIEDLGSGKCSRVGKALQIMDDYRVMSDALNTEVSRVVRGFTTVFCEDAITLGGDAGYGTEVRRKKSKEFFNKVLKPFRNDEEISTIILKAMSALLHGVE